MKISVRVKPNAKQSRVERINDSEFVVSVQAPPKEGKANEALIGALAEYFRVSKSQIKIVSGHTSRNKVVEII